MADTLHLEVATPERLVVDEQVNAVELPGCNGYMGILAGHAPLLSALGPGILTYEGGGGPHKLVVDGGLVEIFEDRVRVLADDAVLVEEIKTDQAHRDLEAASEALRKAEDSEQSKAALLAMQKAQARLDASEGSAGGAH